VSAELHDYYVGQYHAMTPAQRKDELERLDDAIEQLRSVSNASAREL